MAKNPVIAAWIAGGLIWGAALIGLGAMGEPTAISGIQEMVRNSPWIGTSTNDDAYERALDGDPWGDRDLPYRGVYRSAGAPDS